MAFTYSQQLRQVREPLEAPYYEIDMTITDAGDMPDAALFVMSVTDQSDPKSDVLARVATIADLTVLTADRPTAVAAAADVDTVVYYRSTQILVRYTDLPTAVAAKDVLKSRIDELVISWQLYLEQFVADGVLAPVDVTAHPRYNQDAFTLLLKAYLKALDNQTVAADDLAATQAAYATAVANASAAQTSVTATYGVWQGCLIVSAKVGAFVSAADYYKISVVTPPLDPNIGAAYDAAHAALFAPPTCESFCTDQKTAYDTAVAAKATADTAVATARTAYESAKAAYATAQTAVEAALSALRTLKPDFNPTTDVPAGMTA